MSGRCSASAGFVGVAAGDPPPPRQGDVVVGRVAALVLRGAVGVLALLGAGVLLVSPVLGQSAAAPEITSPGPFAVAEGSTSVATLAASDADTAVGDLFWSKAGGADAAAFTLSESGELAFGSAPDYEEPDDSDTDGAYELTVQVSDGVNDVTADLVVTVDNVIELEAIEGPAAVRLRGEQLVAGGYLHRVIGAGPRRHLLDARRRRCGPFQHR